MPFREPANGDKAENEFSPLYPHSLLTVGCFAPHSHPSPPEEKAASRKKSRLRRKKTAPNAKNGASCVSRVSCPYRWAGIVCGCVLNIKSVRVVLLSFFCFFYFSLQAIWRNFVIFKQSLRPMPKLAHWHAFCSLYKYLKIIH